MVRGVVGTRKRAGPQVGKAVWVAVLGAGAMLGGAGAPRSSGAFEFDGWKSGTTLQEAVVMARGRNISFLPEGFQPTRRGFDYQAATREWGRHAVYGYATRMLEAGGEAKLHFTPRTFRLYALWVEWALTMKDASYLRLKLEKSLTDVYGVPKDCAVTPGAPPDVGEKAMCWTGVEDTVTVDQSIGHVRLRMFDPDLVTVAWAEWEQVQAERARLEALRRQEEEVRSETQAAQPMGKRVGVPTFPAPGKPGDGG